MPANTTSYDLARLLSRARAAGIDVEAYRCPCEVCSRTSILCPAAISSIEEELAGIPECEKCGSFDDVEDVTFTEVMGEPDERRERDVPLCKTCREVLYGTE